jgi:tetratricopeptide (TPR) repeat protein
MRILRSYVRLHVVQNAAMLYFLIAGLLTQVPLFNYLGFEFSALMTIPAALISGMLTISFLNDHLTKPLTRRTWLFVTFDYLKVNVLLLLVPLFVMSVNAIAAKNCSFVQGLEYYFLLPVCAMIFSVALAMVIRLFFRHARIIYSLVVIVILLQIVVITYFKPQLFAYNFILGYFPGFTYDETLANISTLVLFREFTLIASLLLFVIFFFCLGQYSKRQSLRENLRQFHLLKGDSVLIPAAFVCAALLAVGHFTRETMNIEFSAGEIQHQLGGKAISEHFIFYLPPEKLSPQQVRVMKAEAEFAFRVVSTRLQEILPLGEKISVYLYPNEETKRRLIGTANTEITKPWLREIHLSLASFHDTFRHELVHALAANFGLPVIDASDKMGLNEGLAMAIDWQWGNHSLHEYAAALLREHDLERVENLFSTTGFMTQQSAFAYVVAGSFCRFLIDRFGIERFKRVFPTGSFVTVYGEPIDVLISEWKEFLRSVDDSTLPRETVETLFVQPSIFHKVCARVTATRNARAVQAVKVKNYSLAENEFSASYNEAPTAFALRGLFQSLLAQRKPKRVIEMFSQLPGSSMLTFNPAIVLLLGDALWMEGQPLAALQCYRKIESMNISGQYSETAALRRMIVEQPQLNQSLQFFYYGQLGDSTRRAMLIQLQQQNSTRDIANYLMAKELAKTKHFSDAAKLWTDDIIGFDDPVLRFASAMHAGETYYQGGAFEEAKSMFWQAKNYAASSFVQQEIDERIDECSFVEERIGTHQ